MIYVIVSLLLAFAITAIIVALELCPVHEDDEFFE